MADPEPTRDTQRYRTLGLAVATGAGLAVLAATPVPPVLAVLVGVLAAGLLILNHGRARKGGPGSDAAPRAVAPSDRHSAALGRMLIETLPSPLLIITRTGRIAFANPAAHAALPLIQPGLHFANLIRAPAFVEAVTATLADGQDRRFEFTTHQGRERFFEARVGQLPAGAAFGPEAQAIVQIEDRTETRRAERLRTDFIANASHELRTPLASIIGYIETLQNHARNDPKARETFLEIMAREAARMQRLVDDLMSLSRIEMSEHLRPVEHWSLNRIAADSASALQPLAARQEVALEIDLAEDGVLVQCDRDQLAQVFCNLIDNAVKYAGPGSTVRVFAAPPSKAHPNRLGVTVSDNGPGIPREHVHRLTERFYRVNASASRARGGTGLGLAIVKHILNRHEGRLEIVSTPGQGSAFTVWLPRRDLPAPVPARLEAERSA